MIWKRIILLVFLIAVVSAKKHRQKSEKKHLVKEDKQGKDIYDLLADDEADEEKLKKLQAENDLDSDKLNTGKGGFVDDPCAKHRCGPGKVCAIDEDGEAKCTCIEKCPAEPDSRRKVCSNHNETWSSDCEVYRMRCLCTEEMDGCKLNKYKHLHVDYYGECIDIGECSTDEMEDFPRRMREWLFNIMQDLARRDELDSTALELEIEAEHSQSRKWVNAVIWKFCDLDNHPHDRKVSRHELFPIRAPLLSMEHCIAPFLDACDENDDHLISLEEWGKCLGLEGEEIEDKCAMMRKKSG